MTLALRYAARSHQGLLRTGNEDSVYAGPHLLAVADGMGGHAAGEVASAVAIAALEPLDRGAPGADLLEALRTSALSANDHLRDMVTGDGALQGMGTTLVAVLFAGGRLGLLHVGDSRCYLLRDGRLTQITHDHTLVQALVDEGRISEDDAGSHPQRSIITRALDGRGGVELDLSVREVRPGDRYLLCTDGLTGPVASRDTLLETLQVPDPQQCADRLVELALQGGGPDNVTVIVADVVGEGEATGAPVIGGAAADAPQAAPARADGASPTASPRTPVPTGAPASAGRGRVVLLALLTVAVLAAVAGTGWAYLRSQYYVGVEADRVAVFRGVSGSIAGMPLSELEQRTEVATTSLSELHAGRVRQGIVADGRDDALAIVQRLREASGDPSPAAPGPAPSPAPSPPSPGVPS